MSFTDWIRRLLGLEFPPAPEEAPANLTCNNCPQVLELSKQLFDLSEKLADTIKLADAHHTNSVKAIELVQQYAAQVKEKDEMLEHAIKVAKESQEIAGNALGGMGEIKLAMGL